MKDFPALIFYESVTILEVKSKASSKHFEIG